MVVIWSQAAPLASNQPNTFSVLNVKISIDQQQRNPEYSLDHSKKKKTARIIIQLWRRNLTSPNTDLTRACAVTGLGVMKCFLLPPKLLHAIPSLDGVDVNCSSDYTTMPPCHHAIIYKLTSWSLPSCEPSHGKNVCKSCGPVLEEESCNLRLKKIYQKKIIIAWDSNNWSCQNDKIIIYLRWSPCTASEVT